MQDLGECSTDGLTKSELTQEGELHAHREQMGWLISWIAQPTTAKTSATLRQERLGNQHVWHIRSAGYDVLADAENATNVGSNFSVDVQQELQSYDER